MPLVESVTTLVRRVLGTTNESQVRALWPNVLAVRELEKPLQLLDDSELRARAVALRKRVSGESAAAAEAKAVDPAAKKKKPVASTVAGRAAPWLIEALAIVREAADRRIGMWNALDPAKGFPDDAWGEAKPAIDAARAALAEDAKKPESERAGPWTIDLPASAYAAVRRLYPESAPPFRMRAHDVQILGAIVLDQGRIAEMRTGEGKTLVASLCCFANAVAGLAVHVVTVNDYLAARDAAWNSPHLRFLGLSIGAIQSVQQSWTRKEIYTRDVVYGTNNEFGFDYLRDNLASSLDDQVQRRRQFAIVDEVDSVLIDEARTPLIISGPAEGRKAFYDKARQVAVGLTKDTHYEVDIKDRHVTLNEDGMELAAKLFEVVNLYDAENMHLPHFLDNAMKAKELYHRDRDYLVVGDEIKIVDEHTGRTMEGRRWSDGLHQAIEAKEGVQIREENQTYATITLQNFFRLYDKLAGMTGTAMTEANEFNAIYALEVTSIPPNRQVARLDLPDLIYGSAEEKMEAIAKEVEELHALGQPVLVGTISVAASEKLSELFSRKGIPHEVLNARQHAREAEIVAKAGQFGSVTISTNMAGRGTDIVLGKTDFSTAWKHWQRHGLAPQKMSGDHGEADTACIDLWLERTFEGKELEKIKAKATTNEARQAAIAKRRKLLGWPALPLPSTLRTAVDVRRLGGLRIVGSERHDARRIDNQLRGRSGRQGDPGSSRFFLSLDDDLMKRFAGPMLARAMRNMGLKDGIPIESPMVSRSVEKAQKRVEEYYFGMRKNLLEYDQVANQQRTIIYRQRQSILEGKDLEKILRKLFRDGVDDLVQRIASTGLRGPELAARISKDFAEETGLDAPEPATIPVKEGGDACRDFLDALVAAQLDTRKKDFGPLFDQIQTFILLKTIDHRWRDHLYSMDHLRHAIGLEAYAQKDPRIRFKEEGFRQFGMMQELIRSDVMKLFFRVQVQTAPEEAPAEPAPLAQRMFENGGFAPAGAIAAAPAAGAIASEEPPSTGPKGKPKPGDPCPCGSGQPYRRCHGR
ncbi:protein translocase subunit SecA [Planctomycetota bacterium]|nr:protein translocase subunit SecA [Planctomycetota bacterium]